MDFAVGGDLRYLSHQETLRLWARVLNRTELPVCHTEGFNPRARISLPLPRPVGVASLAERVVVDFAEPVDPDDLVDRVRGFLPEGMRVTGASVLGSGDRCAPRMVRYRVESNGVDCATLSRRAQELLRFGPIPFDRFVHKTGRHRRMDLRPYLDTLDVSGERIRFSLHVTDGGSIKPAEVCEVLGMSTAGDSVNHLIERTEIVWLSGPTEGG